MSIAIMNYATAELTLIDYVPYYWQEKEIKEYLFTEKGLNLREEDVDYMMCPSIDFVHRHY